MTTTPAPPRTEPSRVRRATTVAAVLAFDALLHLYWSTGATWPAPDERTLSMAVLGTSVPFTPSVLLPLAATLVVAASAVYFGAVTGHRLLRAGALVVATGLLVRALTGAVWGFGVGVEAGSAFFWLNLLLYTPLCAVLGLLCASTVPIRRPWRRAVALGVPLALGAALLFGAYGYRPAQAAAIDPEPGSRFVDTPLARFHYVTAGTGTPVVLLAPGASSTFAWREQVAGLARDHTVFAVDLPGNGRTTLHDQRFRYDLDGMTAAIGTFLDAVGVERAALAGNSWSGGFALAFAQRVPERVDRLLLLAPSGLDERDPLVWELMKPPVLGELITNLGTDRASLAAGLRSTYFANPERVTEEVVDAMWVPSTDPGNMRATVALERGLDWSVTEAALGRVRLPVQVIWGAQDEVLPAAQAGRFAALLPNAQVTVLDGCGHALTVDCAERVTALMSGFLRAR
ncbi:alpha/beta fold hydrolase [Actinomycetes bacterium KLBMP 9759]